VILFPDVIEILRWAVLAIVGQIACGLQPGNRGRVSGVLVGVDDTRRLLDPLKRRQSERHTAGTSFCPDFYSWSTPLPSSPALSLDEHQQH
jgi:hypothetical protein